jgi:ATP-dependent helicase HepA
LKTLRLGQDARAALLEDFRRLPRSLEPIPREWEKWLKGGQPILSVTFDQEAAAENPKAHHLSVLHPLVRQAAGFQQLTEPSYCALAARSPEVSSGEYRFALYRWTKHGVRTDEEIVAVASEPSIEGAVMTLLQSATEVNGSNQVLMVDFEDLDARHYAKWTAAQGIHIANNRQQVEHRIQSLTVSSLGRTKVIEEQIARATNDKIRLMKQSERARAAAEFDRRSAELQQAANSGDIHSTAIVFGTLSITHTEGK